MSSSTLQSIYIHTKPITDLKFHNDGDVFFACSKDATASIVNLKGKVLGTFLKHSGAISTLESNNNNLITAGLDLNIINWDVITGNPISSVSSESFVRGLDYSDQIYFCTDDSMNKDSFVGFYDTRTDNIVKMFNSNDPLSNLFKYQNFIIMSSFNGNIYKLDLRNNQIVQDLNIHHGKIAGLKTSSCKSFFITASEDSTSKIIDSETFLTKKIFESEDPVNSSCIFNTNDKVICAGGINARDVTTTKGKGTFETNFYDIVTQDKIGSFHTHFGTINSLDVHPLGTHYISGGEDALICLVELGCDFHNANFTKFD